MRTLQNFIMIITIPLIFSSIALGAAPEIRINNDDGIYRVEIRSNGAVSMKSPEEGLWSIATDWENDWPSQWLHAQPTESIAQGEWIIVKGSLKTPQGNWLLSDAYRSKSRYIECRRRFEWHGKETAEKTTLSVRFQSPGTGAGVLMPGILYYGNPSGARSGRVPLYTGKAGEESIFEEHRFAMPFVSLEWKMDDSWNGCALHSLPSPVPYGSVRDQWWSMGTIAREQGTELCLLSGPCASNGKRSVIKAIQPGFLEYPPAYLNVPPESVIEKTFYLEAFPVEREGSGFQHPLETSIDIFQPFSLDGFPTFQEIINDKYKFALNRWHDDGAVAGFKKYPNRNFFVIGWCGQAAAVGYALQVLEPHLHDSSIPDKVQSSLDFLTNAEFYDGGFHTWYDINKKEWSRHEPLSQGQGMLNFARAIVVGRTNDRIPTNGKSFYPKRLISTPNEFSLMTGALSQQMKASLSRRYAMRTGC